ncbi:MAG: HAD-IIIC family phosphatase [Clostridia bacterium]|nr:HAD-IIIC family phosphatase [Clostridia bacterium]
MFDLNKIKLIIWDLDDTFWKGTLSEGVITPIQENINLVKNLAKRGIVSSICSKNDYEKTKEKLEELGIWDFFVFSSINWEAKGERIHKLINNMSLRPVNVLFIDDNHINLREAEYFSEGLMTSLPNDILEDLYSSWENMGKDDNSLSRLKQYKVLETKVQAASKASSNEEFLHSCGISVTIMHNCLEEKKRICELIERSNQLNYTKKRSNEEEVESILKNSDYDCAYIVVNDNFGEYGVIGFYALNKLTNNLEHFLFSCRTMGMGIEQYVYASLGYPKLDVVGEVAVQLNKTGCPDWITVGEHNTCQSRNKNEHYLNNIPKILFKGPCDTNSSLAFVKNGDKYDCEFTFVNDKGQVVSSHNSTFHILQSLTLKENQLKQMEKELPFWDEQLYKTKFFSENYDIIFLSVFKDSVSGLYRNKSDGTEAVYGDWFVDLTDKSNWDFYLDKNNLSSHMERERLEMFAEKFEYIGRISQEQIIENLRKLREKLNDKTLLVISVPTAYAYIDKNQSKKNDRSKYNKRLSLLVKKEFASDDNVEIIDYTDYANSDEDFLDTSNHFTKKVYYQVAQRYTEIIAKRCGGELKTKGHWYIIYLSLEDSIRKLLRKNKTLIRIFRKLKLLKRR